MRRQLSIRIYEARVASIHKFTKAYGYFEDTFMKNAKYVEIRGYGYDRYGLLKVTKLTEPIIQNEFFYAPPTNESWGGGSKDIRDPYEAKNVVLKESSIPNSGEGVYAVKDLPPQKPAAFLSMFLYNMEQSLLYSKQW